MRVAKDLGCPIILDSSGFVYNAVLALPDFFVAISQSYNKVATNMKRHRIISFYIINLCYFI